MKGAVLVIGSLFWENKSNAINSKQGLLRETWRNRLDMNQALSIDLPICYGRKSNTREKTFTMIFSSSANGGKGFCIPFLASITSFSDLKEEAIQLARAEGIANTKYPNRLYSNWGAVGLKFNPNKKNIYESMLNSWHELFDDFNGSNDFCISGEDSMMVNNGELNFELEFPQDLDFVLATPTVPNVLSYPSIYQIAEAIISSKSNYTEYTLNNYKNGIRVLNDDELITLIE